MAVTSIREVHVRFVKLPPEEAERRRRTLLELQVRSILNAHRAAQGGDTEANRPGDRAQEEHL